MKGKKTFCADPVLEYLKVGNGREKGETLWEKGRAHAGGSDRLLQLEVGTQFQRSHQVPRATNGLTSHSSV